MERQQYLTTIFWKDDYKNKLEDDIMKEKTTIKYLKNLIKYFNENNIETYKKFDKRDLDKIKKYLESKKMLFYKDCQNNFSIHANDDTLGKSKTLYIYINNEQQYNCDIEIFYRNYDGSIDFHNVKETAENRLQYIEAKYKENKKILKNFDTYFKRFNDKVKDFKKFMDSTSLNNIIDMYIYAREED